MTTFFVETVVTQRMEISIENNTINLDHRCTEQLFRAFVDYMIKHNMVHIKTLRISWASDIYDFRRLKEIFVPPFQISKLVLENTKCSWHDNIQVICDLIQNSSLTDLYMQESLDKRSLTDLVMAMRSPTCHLDSVFIINNDFSSRNHDIGGLFGNMLQINTSITSLTIHNFIMDTDAFSQCWPANRTLTHLILNNGYMSNLVSLADSLATNTVLTHIDIRNTNMSLYPFNQTMSRNWSVQFFCTSFYDEGHAMAEYTQKNKTIAAQLEALDIPRHQRFGKQMSRCLKHV